jgi:hypothetical protein
LFRACLGKFNTKWSPTNSTQANIVLFFAGLDRATDVPAIIRPVDSKAKLESAFAIVGWIWRIFVSFFNSIQCHSDSMPIPAPPPSRLSTTDPTF